MASITLRGLGKSFKDVTVVRDVNLEIRDKEFLVLVGPSGCGKSTCLRMIAGLEDATEGEIFIGERLVNHVSPKDRDIAMVFQSYALYPHMTVYENMAFGLKLRQIGGVLWRLSHREEAKKRHEEIDALVMRAAEMLDLKPLLARKPKELSGGQRQRVALGRAVVRQPQAFLMDEPLSNLDAKLRVQTRAEIIKLHRRLGITTVYVTHDQVEAMTMGDRIAVLKDGVLQQCDAPLNLYRHPANIFVAGFIGSPSMNFFDATVRRVDDQLVLDAQDFRVTAPPHLDFSAYIDKTVVMGIRPSDVFDKTHLPPHLQANANNTLRARCEVTEPMGDRTYLFLAVGKRTLVADVVADTQAEEGHELDVILATARIHVFDMETELAIK